jgi:hypothetical protein
MKALSATGNAHNFPDIPGNRAAHFTAAPRQIRLPLALT